MPLFVSLAGRVGHGMGGEEKEPRTTYTGTDVFDKKKKTKGQLSI